MIPTSRRPFRAEHAGGLLRPLRLADAHERHRRGEIDAASRREAEDDAIREAVARQEELGLRGVTDGGFRHDRGHLDFLLRLDGVGLSAGPAPDSTDAGAGAPPVAVVTSRIECARPIMVDDFLFLDSVASHAVKTCIPSPSLLHLQGGRRAIPATIYPDLDRFRDDIASAYRKAIGHLADAGCTYLQFDEPAFSRLSDPALRRACRDRGEDPDALPTQYADTINAALADRPADMAVVLDAGPHACAAACKGGAGHDAVLEAMFSTRVDGYLMAFDPGRDGGFEPLASLPANAIAVLGLVGTEPGEPESRDTLLRWIEEASRFVPLDRLCLSSRGGFPDAGDGDPLSIEEQWRKLALVVEVAREVWGDA